MPDAAVRANVEDYLRKSKAVDTAAALSREWSVVSALIRGWIKLSESGR